MASLNPVERLGSAVAALVCCLVVAVSAVGDRETIYCGGDVDPAYRRGDTRSFPRLSYGDHEVSGRLDTSSDSELIFDAGRGRSLVIPWSAILELDYGPLLGLPKGIDGVPGTPYGGWSAYPWSYWRRFADHYYLRMVLHDDRGKPGEAMFELGKDIVRPTLDSLQRRTGRDVRVFSLGACVAYKGREACGWGSPSELEGRTTVFIDTRGSRESNEGESYRRILAVVEQARLGVRVVKSAEGADIILAFRYEPPEGFFQFTGYSPGVAVGEVYVSHGGSPRMLLVFDEEARFWKTKPAVKFGQDFVRAYREANRIRSAPGR